MLRENKDKVFMLETIFSLFDASTIFQIWVVGGYNFTFPTFCIISYFTNRAMCCMVWVIWVVVMKIFAFAFFWILRDIHVFWGMLGCWVHIFGCNVAHVANIHLFMQISPLEDIFRISSHFLGYVEPLYFYNIWLYLCKTRTYFWWLK